MSTANTTSHTAVQQLIEQRLDAIDRALLGLLPRPDRLAAVAQVESRIRELVTTSPVVAANPQAPSQGLTLSDAAFSSLAADTPAFLPHSHFIGQFPGAGFPSMPGRRSRLAVSAGVLGIFALALLLMVPVTYFFVEIVGEALGEILAISLLGAHTFAVALGGTAAVGLGIAALVSLNRHRAQLVGHGWAITGLCTGPLPMLLGCAAILFLGLQMGVSQYFTASEPAIAIQVDSPNGSEPSYATRPVANSVSPAAACMPQLGFCQPAGLRAPTTAAELPGIESRGLVPTPPAWPATSPRPEPAPRAAPQPQTESQPAPVVEPTVEPVLLPEAAPAISS